MMRVELAYDVIENAVAVEIVGSIVSIIWMDGEKRRVVVASLEELRHIKEVAV